MQKQDNYYWLPEYGLFVFIMIAVILFVVAIALIFLSLYTNSLKKRAHIKRMQEERKEIKKQQILNLFYGEKKLSAEEVRIVLKEATGGRKNISAETITLFLESLVRSESLKRSEVTSNGVTTVQYQKI